MTPCEVPDLPATIAVAPDTAAAAAPRKRIALKVRTTLCLLGGLAALLGGCRRVSDSVARLAENTRTATEQMAVASDRQNEAREKQIDPYIGEARQPPPLKLTERYETRQGPDGLFVYDTESHSVARIGSQAQAGLTMEQASKAVDALTDADAKGEMP